MLKKHQIWTNQMGLNKSVFEIFFIEPKSSAPPYILLYINLYPLVGTKLPWLKLVIFDKIIMVSQKYLRTLFVLTSPILCENFRLFGWLFFPNFGFSLRFTIVPESQKRYFYHDYMWPNSYYIHANYQNLWTKCLGCRVTSTVVS